MSNATKLQKERKWIPIKKLKREKGKRDAKQAFVRPAAKQVEKWSVCVCVFVERLSCRSAAVELRMGEDSEWVTPGEVLGKASKFKAGRGAYVSPDNLTVYASLTGLRRIICPPPDSPDQVLISFPSVSLPTNLQRLRKLV